METRQVVNWFTSRREGAEKEALFSRSKVNVSCFFRFGGSADYSFRRCSVCTARARVSIGALFKVLR